LLAWVEDYERAERIYISEIEEMGRYAREQEGSNFVQPPEGTFVARCYRIIDLGTQHDEYQGKPTIRNQVVVTWELPTELMDDGKPFSVSRFYTNDLYENANLYKDLVAWRGRAFTEEEKRGFDLENILGAPCLITIVHNDKGKAKVTSVTKLVKGMECAPQVNKSYTFWIEPWNDAEFEALPDGIKKIIRQSDEVKALYNPQQGTKSAVPGRKEIDPDDDIPF
jgi:hypothetical protein